MKPTLFSTITNLVKTLLLILPFVVLPSPVLSWLPSNRRCRSSSLANIVLPSSDFRDDGSPPLFRPSIWFTPRITSITSMILSLTSSDDVDTTSEGASTDYVGKTVYQRTYYRLSPGSQVTIPNALMIEERLRYRLDPTKDVNDGYNMLPYGPRTLIVREGSDQDELTDELVRMDVVAPNDEPHDGPRTLDKEIASILYLASNPQWIQGDVLELSCGNGSGPSSTVGSGIVGLLGCMAAKWTAMNPEEVRSYKQLLREQHQQQLMAEKENIMTVPKTSVANKNPFPKRMHHLTLSDESPDALDGALPMVQRHFSSSQVSLRELPWNVPRRLSGNRRNYGPSYRTIIGSDLELTYPTAKELARTVANILLPSNEFAVANIREGANTSPSFGALGMDPEPSPTSWKENFDEEVDPAVPPTFIHVCPEYRDDVKYLRQFLENGFRMTVNSGYVKMERLQFVVQTLPNDTPEEELDELDNLEVQEESSTAYQSLMAVHHPEYAGEGSGEYFFPLETGAYEGGSAASTYLEPEEGGYAM